MRPRETLCSRRCTGAFRAAPHRTGGTRNAARCQRRSDRAGGRADLRSPCSRAHAAVPLVQAHYPGFIAHLAAQDRSLPEYVREEFEAFLRCGVLEHGFLRVVCEHCHADKFVCNEFEQP